jgi:hypothetical protein
LWSRWWREFFKWGFWSFEHKVFNYKDFISKTNKFNFRSAYYHTQYWRRRGIKGPLLIPFVGILDRLGDPKHPNVFKYNEWSQKYGPYYGVQKGRQNILIVRLVLFLFTENTL